MCLPVLPVHHAFNPRARRDGCMLPAYGSRSVVILYCMFHGPSAACSPSHQLNQSPCLLRVCSILRSACSCGFIVTVAVIPCDGVARPPSETAHVGQPLRAVQSHLLHCDDVHLAEEIVKRHHHVTWVGHEAFVTAQKHATVMSVLTCQLLCAPLVHELETQQVKGVAVS